MNKTHKQKVGQIGENVACRFLVKHGFSIKERNYRKKWGEIDIIAQKENILHFIEVKSVTYQSNSYKDSWFRPEENVHPWKIKRLNRAIQTYLLENPTKGGTDETEWQIDVIAIFLDFTGKKAKIRMTENIIM